MLEARDKWKELGFKSLTHFEKFTVDLKDYGKAIGMLTQLKKVNVADIASDANSYFEEGDLDMFKNSFTSSISGMENLPEFLLELNPITLKENLWYGFLEAEAMFPKIEAERYPVVLKNAKRDIELFKKRYDQSMKLISNIKGAKLQPTKIGLDATVTYKKSKKSKDCYKYLIHRRLCFKSPLILEVIFY